MKKLMLVAAATLSAIAAQAQILLNIDWTNPNAATITATSGASLISSSGRFSIRLLNFYAFSPGGFGASWTSAGNLQPVHSSSAYTTVSRTQWHTWLELTFDRESTQTFVAGQQAFTGTLTTGVAGFEVGAPWALRTSSFVGNVAIVDQFVGPFNEPVAIIGQYFAVPEPATMTAMGVGALALLRRRRKR